MYLTIVFLFSGAITALLVIAKYLGERRKRQFLILRLISKGDVQVREWAHLLAHQYSETKEWLLFVTKKQIPLRTRSWWNKLTVMTQEHISVYTEKARNSRLLHKQASMSDFLKNMSNLEKGKGEINDVFPEGFQEEEKEVN